MRNSRFVESVIIGRCCYPQLSFQIQYSQGKSCRLSVVRDLPPVAGSVIWARQIDNQLTMYLKRVEDVLGKGWETHIDGQKLKADGDSFRAKLSTTEVFQEWARKVQERNLGITGRIFMIDSARLELLID